MLSWSVKLYKWVLFVVQRGLSWEIPSAQRHVGTFCSAEGAVVADMFCFLIT